MGKINVLQFICPTGFYGAEGWVVALANNLDDERVRCDLAVTKESESQNLEIIQRFPIRNGKTFEIPLKGRFDPAVLSKLCKLIRERDIDIIHTHGYKSDILGLLAAKKTHIKCVSTPHGFGEARDLKLKVYLRLGGFSLRFFDKVVPLSQQLLDETKDFGVDDDRLLYVQNGVDLTEIDKYRGNANQLNQAQPVNQASNKKIGYIGQMIPRKKVRFILEVFDLLWKKNNGLELLLVGDGEQRNELEQFAKSLGSSESIRFLGFRKDRMEILRDLNLFVMTSSSEGIPRSLMEAMAMEIPVVAYDIPGVDQLISHQQTGLLAPYGGKQKLAMCCERILDNPEYARKIAAEGRRFIVNNFSAQIMAQRYTEIFESLVERSL